MHRKFQIAWKLLKFKLDNYFDMHIFINLHVLIAVFIKSAIQIDTDSIPKKHQYENSSFLFLAIFSSSNPIFLKVV